MSQRDEHWGSEDEDVVRRLREERPQISAFELDRIKTGMMAKAKPTSKARRAVRSGVRSRVTVAALTLGLMGAGTAGAVASSSGSSGVVADSSGTGAAVSQYHPCLDHPFHFFLCRCLHGHIIACIIAFEIHHPVPGWNQVGDTSSVASSSFTAGG